MPRILDDKVAIVTGASQGLGAVIAKAFGADGAKVLLVARREEQVTESAVQVEEAGGTAAAFVCDLTQGAKVATEVVDVALSSFGRLDIVVNSAGVFVWKKLFALEAADWERTIATNLTAPFFVTQAAAKVMAEQGTGGAITNIASIHGLVGDGNVVPHCASKFGLVGLTKAAAEALREHDIRVNAIAPGAIEPNSAGRWGGAPSQKVTQADVASMAVYLSSHLSKSVTGAVIEMFGSTRDVIKV